MITAGENEICGLNQASEGAKKAEDSLIFSLFSGKSACAGARGRRDLTQGCF
jgi:hypothetical protein